MSYFYEFFHYTRKNKKITLAMLSEEIGVSKTHISLIERGKRNLSYEKAVKIANFLNMTPDELFLEDQQIGIKKQKNTDSKNS